MNILPTKPGVALAVAGAIVGPATGAHHRHCPPPRTVKVTRTRTVYVRSTTKARPVAARVSQRLAAFGSNIRSRRGPYRARPREIIFATSGVGNGLAIYVDHLTWVDWGQQVAYASGIVHTRDSQQRRFVATRGGVVVDQLRSCKRRHYYTNAEMFAPAGYPASSQNTNTGYGGQALTPC
jgi:hypothetical protein